MKISGISSLLLATLSIVLASCEEETASSRPVQVKIMQTASFEADGTRNYTGTISSAVTTNLSFGIPGIVTKVYFTEGQEVRKGDWLAEIDDASYQSAYNTAKSILDQAQDAYDRLKILHDRKALADIKWVEIETKLTQAKSTVEIAEKELSNCRIVAPISGMISACNIDKGQYSVPASTALTIIDPNDMQCTFSVPEKEINLFRKGMEAKVVIPSLGDSVIIGEIGRVGASADVLTHAYEVGVNIGSNPGMLRPGMICRISVMFDHETAADQQIVLPSSAIMLDYDNSHYVWVTQGDTIARRRNVVIGKAVSDGISIVEGLDGMEDVITDGLLKISEGCRIEICE